LYTFFNKVLIHKLVGGLIYQWLWVRSLIGHSLVCLGTVWMIKSIHYTLTNGTLYIWLILLWWSVI